MPKSSLPPILLIEYSDEDYATLVRAFIYAGVRNPLHRCRDGDEALEYLYHFGRYADSPQAGAPALILLDLNLPGTDGREVLAEVKRDEKLNVIPIIVMTTSSNPKDILECYRRGANSYQVKSANYEGFKREILRTVDYWFATSTLPAATENEI